MKVGQNNGIQMWRWFTSVFLMNGKKLRSFSHYQILSVKSVKMIKLECKHDLQVFSWWIEQN